MESENFINKIYTEKEKNYIFSKKNPFQTAAGIYAAKEAVLKALGCGIESLRYFREMEILHGGEGKPCVILLNDLNNLKNKLGESIYISISHDGEYSTACALIR